MPAGAGMTQETVFAVILAKAGIQSLVEASAICSSCSCWVCRISPTPHEQML